MAARGYPRDYLLARIRGRRRYLVGDWCELLDAPEPMAAIAATPYRHGAAPGSDEEIWGGSLREFAWLHAQMDRATWAVFAPLFLYFELRTVVLCLRQRLEGDERRIAELLDCTLLARPVQMALQTARDIPSVVDALSALFARLAESFKGLGRAYREKGVAGFEESLTSHYLEYAAKSRLHPVIGAFVHRLIDVRNAVTLAKHRRWHPPTPPAFIRGGEIGDTLLREAAQKGDGAQGQAIIRRLAGPEADIAAGNLESLLLGRLTREVRLTGGEPTGIGCILDYAWRIAVEARNLSLLVHGAHINRDVLRGELIL